MTKFMWFQLISILTILAILISVCVIEDRLVTNALSDVLNYCYQIEKAVDTHDGILNNDVAMLVDNMEDKWFKHEWKLCYMVNHKSIQEIGVEISKIKTYMEEGDRKEFIASLELIKLYEEQYHHFMGASFHNIL